MKTEEITENEILFQREENIRFLFVCLFCFGYDVGAQDSKLINQYQSSAFSKIIALLSPKIQSIGLWMKESKCQQHFALNNYFHSVFL